MTDLTPRDPSEKSEIYKMLVLEGLLGSESLILLQRVVALTALRHQATF